MNGRMIITTVPHDPIRGNEETLYAGRMLTLGETNQIITGALQDRRDECTYCRVTTFKDWRNGVLQERYEAVGIEKLVMPETRLWFSRDAQVVRQINKAFQGEPLSQWTTVEGMFNTHPFMRGLVYSEVLLKNNVIHQEVEEVMGSQANDFGREMFGYRATKFYTDREQAVFSQYELRDLFKPDGMLRALPDCRTHGENTLRLPIDSILVTHPKEFLKRIPPERKEQTTSV